MKSEMTQASVTIRDLVHQQIDGDSANRSRGGIAIFDILNPESGDDSGEDAPKTLTHFQQRERRAARPSYTAEQQYFLWYHRVDLELRWDAVLLTFKQYWGQERTKSGIQGVFYRCLDQNKVPRQRDPERRRRQGDDDDYVDPRYGVIRYTKVRFPWMQPEHLGYN